MRKLYCLYLKRVLDIVLSALGIVILIIPMGIVSILIKIDDPGPVMFRQRRIGLHKSEFYIFKFRTLPVSAPHDVPTHLFSRWASLSRFQRFLRRYAIDELPQLFNIFLGQMSVVGPRPALWNQYDLIAERDKYGANDVKPGLTGWAQINGRDRLEISDKAKFDGEYAEKISFLFDCRCFFGTIVKLLKADGVVEDDTERKDKEKAGG